METGVVTEFNLTLWSQEEPYLLYEEGRGAIWDMKVSSQCRSLPSKCVQNIVLKKNNSKLMLLSLNVLS